MDNWTPVTELPIENGDYLVTDAVVWEDQTYHSVKTAYFHKRFGWIVHDSDNCMKGKVIAWQKLPEPYRS